MKLHLPVFLLSTFFAFSSASYAAVCDRYTPITSVEEATLYQGCEGSSCPNLECKAMGMVTYSNAKEAKLKGSNFASFGYSKDLTRFINSDLRLTTFDRISASSLAGSNLQGALIKSILTVEGERSVDLTGADLRGTEIQLIEHVDSVILDGALFNSDSRFPFSQSEALLRGMIAR